MTATPKQLTGVAVAVILLALAAGFIGSRLVPPRGDLGNEVSSSSTYERVMKSGRLRAGYINYPPGCLVNTATGEVGGITVEILRRMCSDMDLELDLTEEVGWGTMIQGLESGRYDIMASPAWSNPARGKRTTMSSPVYFSGIGIWVRADDDRFSSANNWDSINQPDVRIAAMDGSTPEVIARTQFPEAKLVTYPDLTGEPQLFLDVVTKKADVFFAEPSQGIDFLENNPGAIKNIAGDRPIRIFDNVFLMPKDEFQLKTMIDTALRGLQNSGFVDRVIKDHEPGPNAFYRVAPPYKTSP